jgi:hypothetical protein
MTPDVLPEGKTPRLIGISFLEFAIQAYIQNVPEPRSAIVPEMMVKIVFVFREYRPFGIAPDFFFFFSREIEGINGDIPVCIDIMPKVPFRRSYPAGIKEPAKGKVGEEIFIFKGENSPVIEAGVFTIKILNKESNMTPPKIKLIPRAYDRNLDYRIGVILSKQERLRYTNQNPKHY